MAATGVAAWQREAMMAKKQTSRGRKQDRARVAGGQNYEVRYEAKKSGKSKAAVKKAVKKVGVSRKRVEHRRSRRASTLRGRKSIGGG
jgi:IS5 family transposase